MLFEAISHEVLTEKPILIEAPSALDCIAILRQRFGSSVWVIAPCELPQGKPTVIIAN